MVDLVGYGGVAILSFLVLWTLVCVGWEVRDCIRTAKRSQRMK